LFSSPPGFERLVERLTADRTRDVIAVLEQPRIASVLDEFHSVTNRMEIHVHYTHLEYQAPLNASVRADFVVFTGDNRTPTFL
jgi:hypothetical protein